MAQGRKNEGHGGLDMLGEKVHLQQVDLLVRQLDSLPVLPGAMARLLNLASGVGGREQILTAIRSEPSVCALLLSLARADRADVADSPEGVLDALGQEDARWVVLAVKALETLGSIPDPPLNRDEFRRHSLAVAAGAELLVRRTNGSDARMAFVCGLLHDVGKLVLQHCLPKSYRRALALADAQDKSVVQAEREVVGVDHTIVGRRLGQHWRLPATVQEAIWLHHQPVQTIPSVLGSARIVRVVQLADAIVCQLRIGFAGNRRAFRVPSEIARDMELGEADLAWVLDQLPGKVEQLSPARPPAVAEGQAQYRSALGLSSARAGHIHDRLADKLDLLQGQAKVLGYIREMFARAMPPISLPVLCQEIARALGAIAGTEPAPQLPVCAFANTFDHAHSILAVCTGAGDGDCHMAVRGQYLAPASSLIPARAMLAQLLSNGAEWDGVFPADEYVGLAFSAEGRWLGGAFLPARFAAGFPPEVIEAVSTFVSYVLAAALDQARSERMAEQLAQSSQLLAEAQQALAQAQTLAAVGEMAAGAAHEMNNPLAVISGRAQLLAQQLENRQDREAADLIARKANDISQIATDLMAFARPMPPKPAAVEVSALFAELRRRVSEDEHLAGCRIECRALEEPVIWADPHQVGDVLLELVRNAATASAGNARLTIEAGRRAGTSHVLIRVQDDGPGMDDATLASAFTPFFSHRPAGRGRGMGLPRAKRCIQANGGQIWIESRPESGTTVFLVLPQSRAEVKQL